MSEILYHYTSQQGLIGIIEENAIWATNLHYLNDEEEYKYPLSLLTEELKNKIDILEKVPIRRAALYSALKQEGGIENEEDDLLNTLKITADSLRYFSNTPIYICSFSRKKDHLGQWRGYTLNGTSFSMGFDFSQMKILAVNQGFSLEPCVYDHVEQEKIIKNLVEELSEELKKEEHKNVIAKFLTKFWKVAPTIKHPSFYEEEEWRLISGALGTGMAKILFRIGKSMIVPYLKFDLGKEFPLREIVVGPSPHKDLSVNSVRILLSAKKLRNIDIDSSSVPYRSW